MRTVLIAALAAVLLAAPAAAASPPVLPDLILEFRADARSLDDAFNLPWSSARLDRRAALVQQWNARLEAVDYDTLTTDDRIDWHLLRNHLAREADDIALERARLAEMQHLLPFREALVDLAAVRLQRTSSDPQTAAGRLDALVAPLKALRDSLTAAAKAAPSDKPPVPPAVALRAAAATDALRTTLDEWFRFHDGYQPDFSWWVRQPHARCREAMEAHARFLREELAGQKGQPDDPLVGDPIGPDALARGIARELLPGTAAELVAVGEREFAWCEARLDEAAAAMGTDRAGALAKVKAAHVPPGAQADLAVAEATRAIDFLRRHDLVSIPPFCEETWRLEMIPPETQKTLPYAVYGQPAMRIAYPTDAMAHEDKLAAMRGNNRHFMRIVTPHELIPGHHLQRFTAARSRTWRSLFSTPFYVEGWALHWEMLLWDLGYADTPEDRVGLLFWRMHRCARIIVSLRFHLGTMTPAEMVDFLVRRVGHEPMGATSEVRRYIGGSYGPLYQAGYMLGGLQLRALHKALVAPGGLTNRAFHDAVLAQNAIPIALVRAALTNHALPRDWQPDRAFGK